MAFRENEPTDFKAALARARNLRNSRNYGTRNLARAHLEEHWRFEASQAAYAHVCEAIVSGGGPGGAAAMAIMVDLMRKKQRDAEQRVRELEARIKDMR